MSSSFDRDFTDRAGRHLQQLREHSSREAPVGFAPETGGIDFPFGIRTPCAGDASAMLVADGDRADLDRLEQAIDDHLARSAFRQKPAVSRQRFARDARMRSVRGSLAP